MRRSSLARPAASRRSIGSRCKTFAMRTSVPLISSSLLCGLSTLWTDAEKGTMDCWGRCHTIIGRRRDDVACQRDCCALQDNHAYGGREWQGAADGEQQRLEPVPLVLLVELLVDTVELRVGALLDVLPRVWVALRKESEKKMGVFSDPPPLRLMIMLVAAWPSVRSPCGPTRPPGRVQGVRGTTRHRRQLRL